MFRPRKSKPPADTSNPTPPAELVRDLTSRKDPRTLFATSTAVALSLGSAFRDTRDTVNDGATIRGRDTGWQTAYGAARIAVEIANETSDMFLPLKAVVGAISILIKNYDQTSDNAEGVKEIERRVQSLSGALTSPLGVSDYAEKGRRVELRRKLEGVIAKLEPLSDQHALVRFLRSADDAKTLTGFVQELANAITDYQVSVQQGIYERTRNIHDDTKNICNDAKDIRDDTKNIRDDTKGVRDDAKEILDLEILAKLEPVCNAGHQAGHHDKCLPGTRQSVLQDIMVWAGNPQDKNVFWLNGLAGTGKSTIAQSFSDMVATEGSLGASFFCSRDYLDRRQLKNIFPTLTYQLACHYPHFRSHIVSTIKKDPTLAHTSLISQLENLLVNPLSEAKVSCVIVIDALDECIDNQPASAILSVLGRFAKQLPLVKFFITGRPEPRIRSGFRLPLLEPITQVFLLHGVELSSVDNDIQLYLTQRLTTIAKQRSDLELPDPWPCDGEIKALTKKSSGLFIFASTLARFIESEHHDPNERLQLVVSEATSTSHEGHAGIDLLYSQVLQHAFSDVHGSEVFTNVKRVLGAIVLAFNPLSRRELSVILGIPTTLISTTLRHLHSIILIPADEQKEIRIFHKSFPDFLQDDERCTDPRFCINPVTYHGNMFLSCLELVKGLERNTCSLPPFAINQDIPNLPQLLKNRLGGAVQYACRYWARHLELSPKSGNYVKQVAVSVVEMLRSAPQWIEVMSLENCLEEVIHSMYGLLDWRDKVISIAQKRLDASQQRLDAVHQMLNTAQQNADTPDWRAVAMAMAKAKVLERAKVMIEDEPEVEAEAEPEFMTEAEAEAEVKVSAEAKALAEVEVETVTSVTTPLYDLGTDCLRLSMHFYHPIQQCALQVYHSALPLSPTSSQLCKSSLQSNIYGQLSHVTAFSGAPDTWGLLLRTIDVRPRQLTCIATTVQGIIAACEDIVDVYDAITGVFRQSLKAPEAVAKIQGSPDGSILFFAHSFSVTMWDVQTGGLIYTFTTKSKINDVAVSATGDRIACGLSDGSVTFWDTHTKEEGKSFGNGQPVVTIHWLFPLEILVAALSSVYVHDIGIDKTWATLPTPHPVWGMVHLVGGGREFLVGTSQLGEKADQEFCTLESIKYATGRLHWHPRTPLGRGLPMQMPPGKLIYPIRVGDKIACIAPPSGVQLFNTNSLNWTTNPPLLDAAMSLAVSLNRNLVAQTKDSIQIFSLDVMKTGETRDDVRPSHIYPLGEKYIICLQPNGHPTLLELETLRELYPSDNTSLLESLLATRSPSARTSVDRGIVAELGIPTVMQAWRSGTPLPEWTGAALLSGLSPNRTRVVTVYDSPRKELRVKDARDGTMLAEAPLESVNLGTGEVYDITFDSETRFYLKIDGPGWHAQIPYDIIASPSEACSHAIKQGEPLPLSEPRATPPYTLDTNCEWVLDTESRKICWISPGNLRRGSGGHFWVGLSLVMLGDDGVVRKLSFKEPDC